MQKTKGEKKKSIEKHIKEKLRIATNIKWDESETDSEEQKRKKKKKKLKHTQMNAKHKYDIENMNNADQFIVVISISGAWLMHLNCFIVRLILRHFEKCLPKKCE